MLRQSQQRTSYNAAASFQECWDADLPYCLLCPRSECLEVKCREEKSLQTGTAGEAPLDRSGMCANDKSVKVKIVDT